MSILNNHVTQFLYYDSVAVSFEDKQPNLTTANNNLTQKRL